MRALRKVVTSGLSTTRKQAPVPDQSDGTGSEVGKRRAESFKARCILAPVKSALLVIALYFIASGATGFDPYANLRPKERAILQPAFDRWIHDQVKHDWKDLWEIQDQTSDLKNELLLGHRDAPDLDRQQYIEAMNETMGSGYWTIQSFSLREIRREKEGYWVLGCGKVKREHWHQVSITDVHIRMIDGKPKFGLPSGAPDSCKP